VNKSGLSLDALGDPVKQKAFFDFQWKQPDPKSVMRFTRPQSRGLESLTAGLRFLRLASRLKPWLRTVYGLGWLMTANHGLRVQTRKLTAAS